jgi:hypothetical protein
MSTTTPNRTDAMNRLYRTRWFMPAFSLFLAAAIFVAYWIGDEPGTGAGGAAILVAMGALIYFGGRRSETISGLGGPAATSAGSASTSTPPRSRASSSSSRSSPPGWSRWPRATTAAHIRSSAPSAGSPTSWRTFLRWRS